MRSNVKFLGKRELLQFVIAFLVTACGVLAAYYGTINGIKLDLSKKAEAANVDQLDKRLSNIEVLLNNKFITKEEFFAFREEINSRLIKIEYQTRKEDW
jgi:hypothetical protein